MRVLRDQALQIEHIRCKRQHGSNGVSNLTLSCDECNKKKGTQQYLGHLRDLNWSADSDFPQRFIGH